MSSTSKTAPPQIAVWYFVAATFVFASPVMFFRDAGLWVSITTLAIGLLLMIGGGIQLGRELGARRQQQRPD